MRYENPILRGFHPDPSICRVGADYYLVVSSFEYFPGLPIYHSRDLVNWKQIGNCIQRAEEFPLLDARDSGGVWAPTIRWDRGVFYVTATLAGHGNFLVTAKAPGDRWSLPTWLPEVGGIDPSLFFEDGRAYYCTNESLDGEEMISMQEIDPARGCVIGQRRALWRGMGAHFLEAPHVYHIGDWYYLLAAEGGTFFTHMATIARSASLWGPYEGCPENPILTNMCDPSWQVQCAGHADLVEDPDGNWWMVHLGIRLARRTMTHLGRETFLTPVRWRDGWPVCGWNRRAALCCEGPLKAVQKPLAPFVADIASMAWEPEWVFLRQPDWSCYRRNGDALALRPTPQSLRDATPTFAAVRPLDFACRVETSFDFAPEHCGDEAGLAIRLDGQFHITCTAGLAGQERMLTLTIQAEQIRHTVAKAALPDGQICLRMTAAKETYHFEYAEEDGTFHSLGNASTRFVATELSGRCFTGTVIGLYATCAQPTQARMLVRSFQMTPLQATEDGGKTK